MTIYGIDISHHQATTPPLTGKSFVIARASIGLDRDEKYAVHIANARAAGCVVGAYHFGYTHLSIDKQADLFVETAGDVDLYAFDVEGERAPTRAQTQQFIDRVRSKGKPCGLYMSASPFYYDLDVDWRWVAKWATTPPKVYDVWQYRGAPLDLDRFEGTADELRALGWPTAPDTGTGEPMIVPQALGHVIVTATAGARIYPEPDGTPIASKLAHGSVVRFFGAVAGWRYAQLSLGGVAQYAWLRADETDDTGEPLTIIDGPLPDPDCSEAIAAATASLNQQLTDEKALNANYADRLLKINGLSAI